MKTIRKNVSSLLHRWRCAYRLLWHWPYRLVHQRTVTLNIEGGAIRVLAMDGKRVTGWGSLPLSPGLVQDGLIVDPAQVGSLIRTLVTDNEMSAKKVNASLTGMRSLPRLLSLPKVKPALVPEAIRYESERQMPVPLDELHLCWRDLGSNGSESQFFVVGVPRSVLDAEMQTLAQAGIKEHVLDLKPMALARAVNRSEAVIIDLEPDSSHIVLVVQGIPVIMRTLILGGEGVSSQDKAAQAAAEVARTVEFYNLSHPGQSVSSTTRVFLTGGLAADDSLADAVRATIDNPIEKLEPAIECPAELPVAEYAVNIGLALKGSAARRAGGVAASPALDLPIAPDGYGTSPRRTKNLSYALLAALVIALLFPAYNVGLSEEASVARLQMDLATVRQQLKSVRQTIDRIDHLTNETEQLKAEREAVVATSGNFGDKLQLVFGALPAGVELASITMGDDTINLNGVAATRSLAIRYATLIEESGLFSAVNIASSTSTDDPAEASVAMFSITAD